MLKDNDLQFVFNQGWNRNLRFLYTLCLIFRIIYFLLLAFKFKKWIIFVYCKNCKKLIFLQIKLSYYCYYKRDISFHCYYKTYIYYFIFLNIKIVNFFTKCPKHSNKNCDITSILHLRSYNFNAMAFSKISGYI